MGGGTGWAPGLAVGVAAGLAAAAGAYVIYSRHGSVDGARGSSGSTNGVTEKARSDLETLHSTNKSLAKQLAAKCSECADLAKALKDARSAEKRAQDEASKAHDLLRDRQAQRVNGNVPAAHVDGTKTPNGAAAEVSTVAALEARLAAALAEVAKLREAVNLAGNERDRALQVLAEAAGEREALMARATRAEGTEQSLQGQLSAAEAKTQELEDAVESTDRWRERLAAAVAATARAEVERDEARAAAKDLAAARAEVARLRGELNEARDRQRAAETERNSVRSLMESESRRFLTRQATLQKNAADMAAEIRAKEAALEQAHGELSALQGREASGGGPASLEEQERALRAKAEEVAERERELRAQMQAALKDFDALAKKKDAYKSETLRLRERRKEMMAQLKTVIQDRDNLAKMVEELTGKPPKTSSVQLKSTLSLRSLSRTMSIMSDVPTEGDGVSGSGLPSPAATSPREGNSRRESAGLVGAAQG